MVPITSGWALIAINEDGSSVFDILRQSVVDVCNDMSRMEF